MSWHATSQGTVGHSQLTGPLWADPGIKSEISVHELISTLKKKRKECRRGMNGKTFSQNSHNRARKKPPPPLPLSCMSDDEWLSYRLWFWPFWHDRCTDVLETLCMIFKWYWKWIKPPQVKWLRLTVWSQHLADATSNILISNQQQKICWGEWIYSSFE